LVELQIPSGELSELVREVRRETDRLVKRAVVTPLGHFPCAFARLTDNPAVHLLIALGEDISEKEKQPPIADAVSQSVAPSNAQAAVTETHKAEVRREHAPSP